jgi:hypothetical protein
VKVKRLIEILQDCDPEAFVTVDLPNISQEYLAKLVETPACLLHFLIEEQAGCSYSGYPHLPGTDQVVISPSLDGVFFTIEADDLEEGEELAGTLVPPDFRPDAN